MLDYFHSIDKMLLQCENNRRQAKYWLGEVEKPVIKATGLGQTDALIDFNM